MNHNTTVDWYQLLEIFVNFKLRSLYLRESCANWILQKNGKIGGPGFTVEIDEALFSKRKNNVRRVLPEQ